MSYSANTHEGGHYGFGPITGLTCSVREGTPEACPYRVTVICSRPFEHTLCAAHQAACEHNSQKLEGYVHDVYHSGVAMTSEELAHALKMGWGSDGKIGGTPVVSARELVALGYSEYRAGYVERRSSDQGR